ncbi:MAG: DUF4190 domain-containing protein [Acidimicrobiales bacterium]|nr:DUF4190 domain-containing protein [Acidimicrobiales bacterium]
MAYPPPGYGGYPQQGYGPVQQEHPQGTTILVLGILSLVVCGLLGPFAWVMGNKAKAEVDARPGLYSNAGNITAGRICGMVATIILILVIVFYALIFGFAIIGSSTST